MNSLVMKLFSFTIAKVLVCFEGFSDIIYEHIPYKHFRLLT